MPDGIVLMTREERDAIQRIAHALRLWYPTEVFILDIATELETAVIESYRF